MGSEVGVGGWRLGVGGWRLEVGGRRLEVGGWGRRLKRYRFEMKIGVKVDEMEVPKVEVEDKVGGATSDFR